MIHRKSGKGGLFALAQFWSHPTTDLQHVCDHIAMSEHGTFRNTCCATCVLQESDIIEIWFYFFHRMNGAELECLIESVSIRQVISRNHLFDILNH
ncbi:hypothetical protein D3C72_1563380 [compost metagenome]